jgi:hypothetical protein
MAGRIVGGQQTRAERGVADAAARIDARAQQKAEMERRRRTVEPRRVHQRLEAHAFAPPQREQALGDIGAVQALERHHVGHGAERHQIEERQQIRLAARLVPEAALAQLALQRDRNDEDDADGGEMAGLERSSCRLGFTMARAGGSCSGAW